MGILPQYDNKRCEVLMHEKKENSQQFKNNFQDILKQ